MKAVVAAFNQEKALVGAFFVITNLRMELFEALLAVQLKNTSREKCIIEISRRVLSLSPLHQPAAAQPVVAGNGYDTMTQAGPGPAAAGLIHRTVFDLAAVPACPILSIRM